MNTKAHHHKQPDKVAQPKTPVLSENIEAGLEFIRSSGLFTLEAAKKRLPHIKRMRPKE